MDRSGTHSGPNSPNSRNVNFNTHYFAFFSLKMLKGK